jgi:hypothetical protein
MFQKEVFAENKNTTICFKTAAKIQRIKMFWASHSLHFRPESGWCIRRTGCLIRRWQSNWWTGSRIGCLIWRQLGRCILWTVYLALVRHGYIYLAIDRMKVRTDGRKTSRGHIGRPKPAILEASVSVETMTDILGSIGLALSDGSMTIGKRFVC